ncbi:MAG: sorbosone dehydrogenase family protein, partial [Mesorhizobium sp.]
MKKLLAALLMLIVLFVVAGGAVFFLSREEATVPIAETYGPNPTLPEPNPTWLPTVHVAKAAPWPQGTKPTAAQG